jgi:tetratricopeptide (TPR) repeat protein
VTLRGAWIAIALCAAGSAAAAPKSKAARAEFDKGVAAYQKQDFAAASAALGRSYALEADTETLFAWAQSERQLGNCDKAIELYQKLLARELPSENAAAVRAKRDECTAIIASQKKPDPEPVVEPEPKKPEREVVPEIPERPPQAGKRPWWKDPLGDTLVLAGVGGLAVGGVFLFQAKKAESDSTSAANVDEFARLDARAQSRGKLGVIVGASGAVLVAAGILRYATRGGGESRAQVTGYFDGTGGGLVAFGRF